MDLDFNADGEGKIRECIIIHQWNLGKKPSKLDYGNNYRTRIFLEMDWLNPHAYYRRHISS